MEKKKSSGLGVAALVLGILAFCFSPIPFINFLALIMGFLAFVLGIIGTATNSGRGMSIAGFILGILSLMVIVSSIEGTINTINNAVDTINEGTYQESTLEEDKGQDIQLSAGTYIVGQDVKAGKYDVKAIKGMGNFFVYGNGSKLNLKVNEGLAASESQGMGLFGSTYNNLRLKNGDEIEITQNLVVKLTVK